MNESSELVCDKISRMFVDASHTLRSGRTTGVQRVVRNICQLLPSTTEAHVVSVRGRKFNIVPGGCSPDGSGTDLLDQLPKSYKYLAGLLAERVRSRNLRRWLLPQPGHEGIFRLPLSIARSLRNTWFSSSHTAIGSGDLLLLPDAYWAKNEIWGAVKLARQRGAFVVGIVYDVIPINYPQFCSKRGRKSFRKYLQQLASNVDVVLTISATVRDELQTLVPEFCDPNSHCPVVRYFTLGADCSPTPGAIRPSIQEIFPSEEWHNPYLMVGSFDLRKNHAYVLDAFDQIWAENPTRKLCLIGAAGNRSNPLMERIEQHPRFGKQLFAVLDATDSEVDYCYRHARAVVMPSIVEGFGLPIVEAQWRERQVFASDTPIHREVGGTDCIYFDLGSPSSLCEKILEWDKLQTPSSPSCKPRRNPVSWQESVHMLWQICFQSYSESKPQPSTVDRRPKAA